MKRSRKETIKDTVCEELTGGMRFYIVFLDKRTSPGSDICFYVLLWWHLV